MVFGVREDALMLARFLVVCFLAIVLCWFVVCLRESLSGDGTFIMPHAMLLTPMSDLPFVHREHVLVAFVWCHLGKFVRGFVTWED